MTRHAVRWVEDTATTKRPFFPLPVVNFATLSCCASDRVHRQRSKAGEYGDFVHQSDWTIGQILDALQRVGIAENTLVLFTSDNGSEITGEVKPGVYDRAQQYGHRSSGELRGAKRDAWEGGHRVPFIARWPGKSQGRYRKRCYHVPCGLHGHSRCHPG
jgi:arylsulfatase A